MKLLKIDYTNSQDEINKQLQMNRLLAEAALYGMKLSNSYIKQAGIEVIDFPPRTPVNSSKVTAQDKSETPDDDVQSEILKTVKEISQQISSLQHDVQQAKYQDALSGISNQIGNLQSCLDDYSVEVNKNGKPTRIKVFQVHEAAVM